MDQVFCPKKYIKYNQNHVFLQQMYIFAMQIVNCVFDLAKGYFILNKIYLKICPAIFWCQKDIFNLTIFH